MVSDLWPPYGLTIFTPRLELRLPREEHLAKLAHLAGKGVHRADKRPFLTPWTDGSPEDRARFVLREHWGKLGSWSVAAWRLGLGVFRHGDLLVVSFAPRFCAQRGGGRLRHHAWTREEIEVVELSTGGEFVNRQCDDDLDDDQVRRTYPVRRSTAG